MELKQFARIQDTPLQQDVFDGIQYFPECGGIGIFIGTVRNHHEGKAVKALKYTAYAPVAEKMIRQIEQEIQAEYDVSYVRVVHRIGSLDIGDIAIIAMAYASHRREAFQACEEAVERSSMKYRSGKKNSIWMAVANMSKVAAFVVTRVQIITLIESMCILITVLMRINRKNCL